MKLSLAAKFANLTIAVLLLAPVMFATLSEAARIVA